MKKLLLAAALAAAAPSVVLASDTEGDRPLSTGDDQRPLRLYAAARISVEIPDANQLTFDEGLGGIFAAGFEVGKRWRAEFSFSRRSTDVTGIPPLEADGAFATWTHLGQVYWHPRGLGARFSPFVAAGAGYNIAKLRADVTDPRPVFQGLGFESQRHVSVAVQGQIGLAMRATKRINVDVSGVYYTSGDNQYASNFDNNPTVEAAFRTYGAQFGMRYRF